MREHFTQGSVRGEPGDRLSYRVDLGLPDISGFDLLEQVRTDKTIGHLPIIVYTGKDLTQEEALRLEKYAESTILKDAKSPNHILDEVMLFLRQVENDLPASQQKKLRVIHDKEDVLRDKTILLVDDDVRNAFAVSVIFEEKGIQTLIAENGKDALEQLATQSGINLV